MWDDEYETEEMCDDCEYEAGITMLFFDVIEALVTQRRNRGESRTATRMIVLSRATEQRDQLCGAAIFDMLWPETEGVS